MKKIIISDDRKLNISNVVIGYLQENKIEKLEFEIPKEYENFGRKACFDANGNTFTKTFDNITGNTITLTRDITQYQDLFMTIVFFKIEDEDEIIARTSTLHILIQDAVICDDDIKPDEPKIIVLDNLIQKVQELDAEISLNESERLENENTRQENEEKRINNENSREEYITNLKDKVDDGEFNGKSLEFVWQGTKLGIRLQGQEEYQFVDLVGAVGPIGPQGNPFQVKKTYSTIYDMVNDYDNMQINDYVMISGNIEEEDNAKLFVKTENETPIYRWQYLADFSGASGIQGPIGKTPNLKIGTVSTLNPNENATVEITGTDENPILNFGIPQGQTYQVNNEDLENIANEITSNANSSFNQNVLTKTNEFNNNATNKTNEFNTNADTKLQEYNTNADNKIAEYDEHSQELNNKIIDTRNELERVKNDVLETGTDTDTFVHLEDSAMAEYQELSVDGVCEQETTTGKNLLPRATKSITKNGITFTANNDGSITVNGTATADVYYNLEEVTLQPGRYTLSGCPSGGSASTYRMVTKYGSSYQTDDGSGVVFTLNEATTPTERYIKVMNGATLNNKVFYPMIENGSSKTNYEPYTGGQPSPSPDFPQPISTIENSLKITSCNKNLWDEKWEIGSLSIESGGAIANDKFIRSLNYIPIKPNTNYYGVYQNGTFAGALYYDKNKKYISKTWVHFENKSNLTPSNAYYYKVVLDSLDYENKFALIEGTNGEYEQHLETQITANLPEGEFIGKINDTHKDTLNVIYKNDGHYHLILNKMIDKVVLDGSDDENWLIYGTGTPNFFYYIGIANAINGVCKSNYFTKYDVSGTNTEIGININGNFIRLRNEEEYTIENFKKWLNSHNTEVYYALATPYEVDLGIVDTLLSYDEITNLFTDSDLLPQINAKYYRNFISTVRNLQVNEKALKQELIDINTRLSALETAQTSTASESEVVE